MKHKRPAVSGKPIQLRPPADLREQLEAEAARQNRSLNNLIIVLLSRLFATRQERERVGTETAKQA